MHEEPQLLDPAATVIHPVDTDREEDDVVVISPSTLGRPIPVGELNEMVHNLRSSDEARGFSGPLLPHRLLRSLGVQPKSDSADRILSKVAEIDSVTDRVDRILKRREVIVSVFSEHFDDAVLCELMANRFDSEGGLLQTETMEGEKYDILLRLGKGGQGSVYYARKKSSDPSIPGEEVALKQVAFPVSERKLQNAVWQSDDNTLAAIEAVTRFANEAFFARKATRTMGALTPECLDSGVAQNIAPGGLDGLHPYIAYGLLKCISLEDLIEANNRSPISREAWLHLILLLATALHAVHADAKLVHRDVKPGNFLIDLDDGTVKISDFGLAVEVEAEDSGASRTTNAAITQAGQAMGTHKYMAPEQWEDTSTVTSAADIYSLFCVLSKALTGRDVFTGRTIDDIKKAHKNPENAKRALLELRTLGIPEEIVQLFRRVWLAENLEDCQKPEDRPTGPEIIDTMLRLLELTGKDGQVMKSDEFKEQAKEKKHALALPEEIRIEAAKKDPLDPYGFTQLRQMATALRDYRLPEGMKFPEQINEYQSSFSAKTPTTVMGSIRKRMIPIVTAAGILVTGAITLVKSNAKNVHSEKEPVPRNFDPNIKPAAGTEIANPSVPRVTPVDENPTVVQVNPAKKLTPEQIFRSSKHFRGIVTNGKLTEVILFPDTPDALRKNVSVTYASEGIVSIVHFTMELEELSTKLGVSKEDLPLAYQGSAEVPAFIIVKPGSNEEPGSNEFVLQLPNIWLAGSDTDDAHLYSNADLPTLRSHFGQNTSQSPGTNFRNDQRILSVLESLPDSKKFGTLDPAAEQNLGVIKNWLVHCRRAQAQTQK